MNMFDLLMCSEHQPGLTWHHQGLTCVLKPADLLTYLPCYLPCLIPRVLQI